VNLLKKRFCELGEGTNCEWMMRENVERGIAEETNGVMEEVLNDGVSADDCGSMALKSEGDGVKNVDYVGKVGESV